MGKPKQVQTNQATYGWQHVPETADMTAYRNAVGNIDLTAPVAQERAMQLESVFDPTYMPTDMNAGDYQKVMQSKKFQTNQQYGMDLQRAKLQGEAMKTEGLGNVAQMTAPRLVQTGGRGESYQQGGGWAQALQIGGSVAMA